MAGAQDLPAETLPAAHEIAHPLLGLGGDPYGNQLSGPLKTCVLDRIPPIVFPAITESSWTSSPRYSLGVDVGLVLPIAATRSHVALAAPSARGANPG